LLTRQNGRGRKQQYDQLSSQTSPHIHPVQPS
jgi:hypothetical protein